MNIPFTIDQFFEIIREYNTSIFPMQIILNLLALVSIILAIIKSNYTNKFISITLGFFWLWMGIVYHFIFFTKINPAAFVFAIFFVLQGIIFIYYGAVKNRISFGFRKDWIGMVGLLFIIYALLIYPILGILLGHTYPDNPTFGLPCPTTIFTFGILLWTMKKVPIYFVIIPFLWSIIGLSAAINIRVYEDFGLIVAGITATILLLIKNKKMILSDKTI
jgi:hypothetical protein